MRIPNFKTEEGSILYKDTVGRLISPRVAQLLITHAKSFLSSPDSKTVLDLGCGPGTISIELARAYPHLTITATDASDSMVSLAKSEAVKQRIQNVQFQQMNKGHLAIQPNSIDLVLCNLAFPFFAKPYDSMHEVFSVIRPRGAACFTVPGRNTWNEFFEVASSTLGDMVNMAKPFLAKFSQAEVLPEAMKASGFTEIEEMHTLLPFHFDHGREVLEFFSQLFHLLDFVTSDLKTELADAIDREHPDGFTMHYEVVLLSGQRTAS